MRYREVLGSVLLLTSMLSLSLNAHGASNNQSKIDRFFDKFNAVSNRNSSEALNSQLGVHFLGGSGAVRSGVYDVNPLHVALPKFSAGCGGIDYTLGGINIASKDEIKKSLKSIASNGVGYAFLLGMETVSPSISSTMKQVQTWANQLNSININSCELASSLVQGAWPKSQRASSYICEHAATNNPLFRDLIESKHGCRDDVAKKDAALNKARKEGKDTLIGNYNIAWKVLESTDLDQTTKELFMTLTGTIVVSEKSGPKLYPPQFKRALELIEYGGKIEKAYHIDADQITVSEAPLDIPVASSWRNRIYKTLCSLQKKIIEEAQNSSVELSEDEKTLISTTRFPLGSFLSLMGQWNGGGSGLVSIEQCAELIAFERVASLAEEVLRDVLHRAEALRIAQIDGYQLDEYIKEVQGLIKELHALESSNFRKMSEKHQVIDYLLNLEKNLKERERGA